MRNRYILMWLQSFKGYDGNMPSSKRPKHPEDLVPEGFWIWISNLYSIPGFWREDFYATSISSPDSNPACRVNSISKMHFNDILILQPESILISQVWRLNRKFSFRSFSSLVTPVYSSSEDIVMSSCFGILWSRPWSKSGFSSFTYSGRAKYIIYIAWYISCICRDNCSYWRQ